MIRLLHLADVHLGRPFQTLGAKGTAQRRALEAALTRAVDLAVERRVHLVLIAGDLFDSPRPLPAALEVVGRQLRRLEDARIRAAVVAGNHDAGEGGFVAGVETLRRLSPGTLWIGREVEVHTFPELDLALVARSPVAGAAASPLAGWPARPAARYAVGLTHGSFYRAGVVETPGVIHPQEVREAGLDYLALGDWHSAAEVVPAPTTAWYAGAPELLSLDQEGAGHVLLVEIPERGRAVVTRERVGRRRYRRLDLDLALLDDEAVRRAIQAEAGPEVICDVTLRGVIPLTRLVNAPGLEEELAEQFFRLRVANRTRLWLDDDRLAEIPAETVLGTFIRLMRARLADAPPEQRPLLEEALQVGVAVLRGGEVVA